MHPDVGVAGLINHKVFVQIPGCSPLTVVNWSRRWVRTSTVWDNRFGKICGTKLDVPLNPNEDETKAEDFEDISKDRSVCLPVPNAAIVQVEQDTQQTEYRRHGHPICCKHQGNVDNHMFFSQIETERVDKIQGR